MKLVSFQVFLRGVMVKKKDSLTFMFSKRECSQIPVKLQDEEVRLYYLSVVFTLTIGHEASVENLRSLLLLPPWESTK